MAVIDVGVAGNVAQILENEGIELPFFRLFYAVELFQRPFFADLHCQKIGCVTRNKGDSAAFYHADDLVDHPFFGILGVDLDSFHFYL